MRYVVPGLQKIKTNTNNPSTCKLKNHFATNSMGVMPTTFLNMRVK